MLSALHAALIDLPASTRLLTFRTIASLSKFAIRLLLLFGGVGVVDPFMMANDDMKQTTMRSDSHVSQSRAKI